MKTIIITMSNGVTIEGVQQGETEGRGGDSESFYVDVKNKDITFVVDEYDDGE